MAVQMKAVNSTKTPKINDTFLKAICNFKKEAAATVKANEDRDLTMAEKARFLAVAKQLTDTIKVFTDAYEAEVKGIEGFKENFVDLGKSVWLQEGVRMFEISTEAMNEMDLAEIKVAAKLTESGLKVARRSDLIDKYKVETGRKAPSVKIGAIKG